MIIDFRTPDCNPPLADSPLPFAEVAVIPLPFVRTLILEAVMREHEERHHSGMTGGLILITIGTLFLLRNLDLLEFNEVWKYWPVLLIAIGVAKLAERGVL